MRAYVCTMVRSLFFSGNVFEALSNLSFERASFFVFGFTGYMIIGYGVF
jgi:hypothetical protein